MKKLFMLVGSISLILFACQKIPDPKTVKQKVPGLTNPGDKKVTIKVVDIYSKLYAIKRRIDIINQKTNAVLGKMFFTLSCKDTNENLNRILNYEPEKFSGQITLQSRQLIEFTKRIIKGKEIKVDTLLRKDIYENSDSDFDPGPELDPVLNLTPDVGISMDFHCSFFEIISCFNTTMANMYWQDIAKCALNAAYCFGQTLGNCESKLCK